jgi:6-pyruvoyltetrahydropterin/6-carboxytetrahydropterin synthase
MNKNTGFVEDFSVLKKIVNEKVIDILDHQDLNELSLPFSDNPTCERILEWVWGVLEETFKPNHYWIQKLTLYEAPESCAELP